MRRDISSTVSTVVITFFCQRLVIVSSETRGKDAPTEFEIISHVMCSNDE